ncbi:MAG: glycosyltransferase [Prevotella sp.]
MILSIIIPVYNCEDYIEECIQSIVHQNIEESYEIIIIDDGSVDNSLKICKKLSLIYENIKIIQQKNSGPGIARNVGLKLAQGEYIYFIDADDYLNPSYFNALLKIAKKDNLDFIGFNVASTSARYNDNIMIHELVIKEEGNGFHLIANFNYNNGPWWYFFKKDILGDLCFEENRLCEDGIFTAQLIQLIKNGRIYKNYIYNYYQNPHSTVNTSNIERKLKMLDDMFYAAIRFNEIIDTLPKSSQYYENAFTRLKERQESYVFFAIVRFLKSKKNYSELLPYLQKLKKGKYSSYPIKYFKGYNSVKNEILIICFNSTFLLKSMIFTNKILNFLK